MTTVYTIGYEGTDIKQFVETLVAVDIKILADVRAVAISRKRGFSKRALQTELAKVGIEYQHFVALGDPKEGREAARAGDIEQFKKVFSSHLKTADAQRALLDLTEVARKSATCLMCFERDPRGCHRSIVAAEMACRGISTFDLYGDSPGRYVRNRKHLPSHNTNQSGAARQ
jgi:uncharacterized protein (DUF488 family)